MEDFGELNLAVGRELDCLVDRVNEPAEDDLAGAPASIALEEFLQGHRFVAAFVGHFWLRQDLVDGVQQVLSEGLEATVSTLSELDEVIDEHVGVPKGFLRQRLDGGASSSAGGAGSAGAPVWARVGLY